MRLPLPLSHAKTMHLKTSLSFEAHQFVSDLTLENEVVRKDNSHIFALY
jgi:hypothetical protein